MDELVALLRQQLATREQDDRQLQQTLRDAGERAAAAEATIAQLQQQNERLQQQNERLQHQVDANVEYQRQQIDDARAEVREERAEARAEVREERAEARVNAQFMRDVTTTLFGALVSTTRFNNARTREISDDLNDSHQVNASRPMAQKLQPQFMYSKKRDGEYVTGNFTRGQRRYVNEKKTKLVEEEFRPVQTVSVGSGINMGQLLADVAMRDLPLGHASRRGLRGRDIDRYIDEKLESLREMPRDLRPDQDTLDAINHHHFEAFIRVVRQLYEQAMPGEWAIEFRRAVNQLMR